MERWSARTVVLLLLAGAPGCEPGAADPGRPQETRPSAEPTVAVSASGLSTSSAAPAVSADPSWDPGRGEPQRVEVKVTSEGFVPEEIRLIRGRPGFLDFKREAESECLNAVRMPWMAEATPLPLHRTVPIQIPDMSREGEFQYSCWMSMVFGKVVIGPPP